MRVHTRLGELYVEVEGDGPPVVLWHSFLHHGGMWRPIVPALRERHRVINIDAPGHGRSSPIRQAFAMDACARAVVDVLDAAKVERAAFCGLSWGGMTAMSLALARPERLSAIALLDTSCRSEPLRNRIEYALLGAVFRRLGAVPFLISQVEPLLFAAETPLENPDVVDAWQSYVARMDRESVWFALRCISGRRDIQADLARMRLPALVVVGELDRAQGPAESRAIAAAIPGARLVIIPRAGHLSVLERPRAVEEVLLPFLREHAVETRAAGATAGVAAG